jgi:hypothetical protein
MEKMSGGMKVGKEKNAGPEKSKIKCENDRNEISAFHRGNDRESAEFADLSRFYVISMWIICKKSISGERFWNE